MNTNLRRLVYVPILHAREDSLPAGAALQTLQAGGQAASILHGSGVGSALARENPGFAEASRPQSVFVRGQLRQDRAESSAQHSPVGEMWAGITAKIEELNLPWNKTRIYQDGLPVSGKELEIVTRLADNGSWNHLLILNLLKKGAKLEGTENIDFLMREYDLLNILLMKNSGIEQSAAMAELSSVAAAAKEEYQAKSRDLLKLRDEFILNRFKATLREGEVGIVFMGVMHRLDKMLEKDFLISYVIYRLPFRSVGAIYNA